MAKQLFYEDVELDAEIPALVKHPTTRQLVKWAVASGDYNELHYDKDFAQKQGLPGVIVHGALALSFAGQLITDWMGELGTVLKLGCNYTGMLFPGEDAICKGKIIKKYIQDSERCYVECEIWIENPRGERTATGVAILTLPTRGKASEQVKGKGV